MFEAGLGGALISDANAGIPQGPIEYESDEWLDLVDSHYLPLDSVTDSVTAPVIDSVYYPFLMYIEALEPYSIKTEFILLLICRSSDRQIFWSTRSMLQQKGPSCGDAQRA